MFQLENPLLLDEVILYCTCSYYFSNKISEYRLEISGWRFTDHIAASKVSTKNVLSTLNSRECNSQLPKQESYQRDSYAIATSDGEYKDGNSVINIVSFSQSILFTCFQANLFTSKNTFYQNHT